MTEDNSTTKCYKSINSNLKITIVKTKIVLLLLCVFSMANAQTSWNFTSDLEGWHDLGAGRDVTASWDTGSLKMTYFNGSPDPALGPQLWFAAIQVDNLNFDAANYRYLELNYQANNWPTTSPVKMLVTLTKSDNQIIYSYVDIDPTKKFISIDIQANNPGWGQVYNGTIKSIQLELPHNGDAASNPATNWFSASTLIDKIKLTNTPTPQDIVWDFTASTEGWNPYGDDVTTSHSGSNLVVTYTGGGDGAYNYTTIYTPVSISAANIDKFYMKFTAHNWVKTSVLVNILFEMNGTAYYANQTMTVANGEFTFDIRDEVQNAWNNLPTSGTISQIRIEIPHSSELSNASDWNGATLDIDRIVFSKSDKIAPVLSNVTVGPITSGDNISVTSDEDATVCVVPEGTAKVKATILTAALFTISATATVAVNRSTTGLSAGNYIVYAIDASGNVSNASPVIKVNAVLTLLNRQSDSKLIVYPNPVIDVVTFNIKRNLTNNTQIRVFNSLGQTVETLNLASGVSRYDWNTAKIRSGTYFYDVTINGVKETGVILKK